MFLIAVAAHSAACKPGYLGICTGTLLRYRRDREGHGTVTLHDNKTSELEQVAVNDPAQLKKLSVGQAAHCSIGAPLK